MKNNEIEISNVKYKIIYFSPKKQDKKDISDLIQNSTYITSIPLSQKLSHSQSLKIIHKLKLKEEGIKKKFI